MEFRETCTVGDLLVRGAHQQPDRRVVVMPDREHTYASLLARAIDRSRGLIAIDVRPGDRVGLLMPNSMDYIEYWFATVLLGAVAVPINGRFRAVELGHVIPDAGVSVLVVGDQPGVVSFADRLVAAFPKIAHGPPVGSDSTVSLSDAPSLRHLIGIGEVGHRRGFTADATVEGWGHGIAPDRVHHHAAGVSLRQEATIYYTSGTTALPKGCVLTHEAMSRQGAETAKRLDMRDGDVMLSPLPMFHTGHTQAFYAAMSINGTYCTMSAFSPDAAIELIAEAGVTVMFTAFPPITRGILDHPSCDAALLRGVRTLFNVAPPSDLRALQARLGSTRVVTGFGMTEFAGSLAISSPHDPIEERVVPGRPLRGAEVEIRDLEDGRAAAPGAEGEIVVRSVTSLSGYHGMPDATGHAFDSDGWFHTGDLGVISPNGLLDFRGRLKDMLKVGGENVGALEIEAHIMTHPAVHMVSVVGVPDERYGEVPVAFVEAAADQELTAEEIIAHCDGQLASFKVPKFVRFVTEWPMSATKIRKVELRQRIAVELDVTSDIGASPRRTGAI